MYLAGTVKHFACILIHFNIIILSEWIILLVSIIQIVNMNAGAVSLLVRVESDSKCRQKFSESMFNFSLYI